MADTFTSNIVAGGLSHFLYDKDFLETIFKELRLAPLGQVRPLPNGSGKTVRFFRYNSIPLTLTSGVLDSEIAYGSTEATDPTATAITGQELNTTINQYGGFSRHSRVLKKTHIDVNMRGVSQLWGEHAANSVDLLCGQEVSSNGSMAVRADQDDTFKFRGTVDSATATTITDSVLGANANFGDTDDDLIGATVWFTSGTAKGQARQCTDFDTTTNVLTFAPALDVTPAAGDGYTVVGSNDLVQGTDLLTTANVRHAVRLLKENSTPKFDGFYMGILSPGSEEGLMADTNWVASMEYAAGFRNRGGLMNGEVGKWGGVRFVSTTQPFTWLSKAITTDPQGPGDNGTEYLEVFAGSNVHAESTFIMGKNAFGRTSFADTASVIRPGIIIKNPGPQSTDNPLNLRSTVGWILDFVAKGLQPLWAVSIWNAPKLS